MPEYAFLILSAFLFSSEFIFVKLFENKNGSTYTSALCFSLGSSVIGLPILFICNGFALSFSWYSLLMAGLLALVSVLANIIGIKAVSLGSLAVYTLFMMLGGMIVPFLVGATFLQEQVTIWCIIATVMLIGALVLPVFDKTETQANGKSKKTFWLFILLCAFLFMLNGANSTIGNLHQNEKITYEKVGTVDFLIWKYIFKIFYCGVLFVMHRKKEKYKLLVQKSSLLAGAGFAVVHITATLLQLYCAITVNASLMYPLVTGGVLIFTPILSRFLFKEKLTAFVIAEIVISVVATVLFVF